MDDTVRPSSTTSDVDMRVLSLTTGAGDILHLNVLGDSTVVLGNAELELEYLEKRSSVTSDRKQSALIEL